ncbi:DUF4276 family protein [Limnothrix sp. FACHB-881]|uniref:DUF4276 family protein n=1 Tax=Limnothrix sp. FACHB-881 TaxID=2692819 RepID=UPI0019CAFD06|nr:DUF4276 family protein [Limnothrix sp. FACHB-881]MBD2634537.1 DUF4276 family protein [Limnothrix sp. FACHB-881]
MIFVNIAVEDDLSEIVLRKILEQSESQFSIMNCLKQNGSGFLRKNAVKFNTAAQSIPFIVLTDLDQKQCPVLLIKEWLGETKRHRNFLLRIAVHEIESWVMADRSALAKFLQISDDNFLQNPDDIGDPKRFLLNVVSKKCRKRSLKEALLPLPGSTATQGRGYNLVLGDFIRNSWRTSYAVESSPSLRRATAAINQLADLNQLK